MGNIEHAITQLQCTDLCMEVIRLCHLISLCESVIKIAKKKRTSVNYVTECGRDLRSASGQRTKQKENKKVLLCERKRHTTRRVVSTPSVVLTGYPPRQGTPPS